MSSGNILSLHHYNTIINMYIVCASYRLFPAQKLKLVALKTMLWEQIERSEETMTLFKPRL